MAELNKVLENDVPAFKKLIKKVNFYFPNIQAKALKGRLHNA